MISEASKSLSYQIANVLSDGEHRRDIIACINPTELDEFLKLKGLGLVDLQSQNSRQKNAELLLRSVQERGREAFTDFLWCLEQTSDSHLGHKYVIEVLLNMEYDLETLGDFLTSAALKSRCQELSAKMLMIEGLNVHSILPQLRQKGLLTDKEEDELSTVTRKRGVIKLESILVNKGPYAYLYFIQALIDAREENPHLFGELFKSLFRPIASVHSTLLEHYQQNATVCRLTEEGV